MDGGADTTIANLKSEIGRLSVELEQWYKSVRLAQSGKTHKEGQEEELEVELPYCICFV